jgi:hypothetical protein
VETVAEPGNVFAGLLNDCEVLGLRRIARELAEKRKGRVSAEKDTFRFRRAAFECVFITVVPKTKLCAWGEEDSGGHVL